jgi:hypothetical protein
MINIHSIKAVVTIDNNKKFGFEYNFKSGLNILTGDNSSGKSTVLSCIYYCLGMEQLASYGNNDGLKECLKTTFKYNNQNFNVFESYAELHISNEKGENAVITRSIKSQYKEDPNLLSVQVQDGDPEDKFVHATGDTDHVDGFYSWLSNFSNISIPIFKDEDGKTQKILYLQQIFASSFVEQTKGWSDFFAQIPVFSTKKAKQKIVEYTLGLSGLVEEFELDRLKQIEKEYKTVWSNTIETFQAITSYYNFLTPNLSETFSIEFAPKKIAKLDLTTRDTYGNYKTLNDEIATLKNRSKDLAFQNLLLGYHAGSAEITKKHADLSEKLSLLNMELQKVEAEKVNEEIKLSNYVITVEHLNREIEALEGINKLNKLQSFHIGAVENCPVCNSSLLTNPDLELKNIDRIESSKSITFYKSEKSLYESYIKSSKNLTNRFEKTILYYREKIAELKNELNILDRQLVEDSRIPSRAQISEEMRVKFELEKMLKISEQFKRFKFDLSEIAEKLAKIRARKEQLKQNSEMDQQKIIDFRSQFVKYLDIFGYSKEILQRIYISQEESNKLFPVVNVASLTAQPIRLVSSASDFIRAQWAFYMTLLLKAKFHLGILILDEPGQHAIASTDLQELLKQASKIKDRQILVAISKEDTISTKEDGQKKVVEINLMKILNETKLIRDKDYTLNIIESNGRKDKCIQPLE